MITGDTQKVASVATVDALLQRRFSCRGFRREPVERASIVRLLELAQQSPSWCNTQPWQVIVTEGAATERLREAALAYAASQAPAPDIPFPEKYDGIFRERRRECAWQLYESVGVSNDDRAASATQTMKNFEFFGAPHVAIITTERDLGAYGCVDCGVYVGSFLLAAQSLGISTITQGALAVVSPEIREQFALPHERQVLCGISFGYADEEHPANGFRTRRAAIDDVVTWASE